MTRAEARAREFAARLADGAVEGAAELLTEDGRDQVVDAYPDEFQEGPVDAEDALEGYWRGLYGQYGVFRGVGEVDPTLPEVAVELRFADSRETATVEVADGGIAGLSFSPEYETPGYVTRETFTERDVTVDAGDVELNGLLAVPGGDGPFPGVLLVHGRGVHNPDGSVGATRLLRDLAWGLASDGIATLRYEKRLADHDVPDAEFTLDNVVTDDAVAAASTLAGVEAVAADELFVAGHSQGGMCAPRIADRYGTAAGAVLLDPPADALADPDDLAWLRYGMDPDGELTDEQRAELEEARETFRRIADGDFADDETVLGRPGTWHRSHHDCTPVDTASGLDAPVFVLTTGRVDEERQPELYRSRRKQFEAWRTADLPDGSHAEFYENVGHYFQAGPTPVTPTRLYFGGNVERHVVDDVKGWIRGVVDSRESAAHG